MTVLIPLDIDSKSEEAVATALLRQAAIDGLLRQGLNGLIIIHKNSKGDWGSYWNGEDWETFHDIDGQKSGTPKVYLSVEHVRRGLKSKNQYFFAGPHNKVAFWIHPESDYLPLERYEAMTGSLWPGSPRH